MGRYGYFGRPVRPGPFDPGATPEAETGLYPLAVFPYGPAGGPVLGGGAVRCEGAQRLDFSLAILVIPPPLFAWLLVGDGVVAFPSHVEGWRTADREVAKSRVVVGHVNVGIGGCGSDDARFVFGTSLAADIDGVVTAGREAVCATAPLEFIGLSGGLPSG